MPKKYGDLELEARIVKAFLLYPDAPIIDIGCGSNLTGFDLIIRGQSFTGRNTPPSDYRGVDTNYVTPDPNNKKKKGGRPIVYFRTGDCRRYVIPARYIGDDKRIVMGVESSLRGAFDEVTITNPESDDPGVSYNSSSQGGPVPPISDGYYGTPQ